jgi:hypothetical protein
MINNIHEIRDQFFISDYMKIVRTIDPEASEEDLLFLITADKELDYDEMKTYLFNVLERYVTTNGEWYE